MKAWMVEMPQWICEIESFVYIFYFQYSLLELTDFFLAPQVKAHAYDSFFSSTFINKSNIWLNSSNICEVPSKWCKCLGWSGTYKLELLRKNSAKKTFKKLNFEIITKNIWITNSKTIVSISVKWKKKKNTPYNVNFKINEMLILIFITVFI